MQAARKSVGTTSAFFKFTASMKLCEDDFDDGQLDRYEALLATNEDPQIYAWAIGRDPVPMEYNTDVMALLKAFKLTS